MRARQALLVCAAALLAACASNTVRLSYPMPGDAPQTAAAKALSAVYVAFEGAGEDDDLGGFAKGLDAALAERGGNVLAYRRAEPGPDPYVERLAPRGVLHVSLEPAAVTRADFENEVKSKGKDGVETTSKVPMTRLTARMKAAASLEAPDLPPVETRTGVQTSQTFSRETAKYRDDADWLREKLPSLFAKAGKNLGQNLPAPASVTRTRTIYEDEKDEVSKQAAGKAREGHWEDASALWAQRMEGGSGSWRDLANLALAAEVRKVFPEAERLYRKAREAAGADPEAAKVPWDAVLADLAGARALVPRVEAAHAWFSAPLAVLPFSDETTSVDGPENLRRMAARALEAGGYLVIPLDEVDAALRRHGFSQGGQLKLGTAEKFAAWTGAQRLLFGHVAEFRNIMLGVYGRREVSGNLRLWDKTEGEILSVSPDVVREETAKGDRAAANFFGELASALFEGMLRKPLGAESARFLLRGLQGLPLKPPAR